ncbi:MAG: hypothetical protein ABSH32_16580 [Bryobacteraceae bacterium]
MAKPLCPEDFRAVRIELEDDDFAIVPEDPDRPPRDLIDRDAWNSIVTLPDDVAIRTSNDYGCLLGGMDRCWDGFIDSLSMRRDPIETAILDAADEFHAATYNSLHGFYRQAFGCLRNALETVAIATYCQVTDQRSLFREREAGKSRIEFGRACDGLITAPRLTVLRARLRKELGDSIFDQRKGGASDTGGWARRLFSDLSEYEHSRPKFRNADMWESNGPVFSPTAFTKLAASFFETAALCFLMVKMGRPRFSLPERAREIWDSKVIRPSRIATLSRDILY